MNQILMVENRNGKRNKNNNTIDIKKIVMFFSVVIIIFGGLMIVKGITGMNTDKPKVAGTKTPEPKVSPTPNQYVDDEDAPVIELLLSGEKVRIVATDDTAMDYIEYSWNDDETKRVNIDEETEDETQMETSVSILQGKNTLNVKAVDKAGNEQEKTQSFQGKVKPEVTLLLNSEQNGVIVKAECADGLSKLEYTLNGEWYRLELELYTKEEWETVPGVTLEWSEDGKIISAQYIQMLLEGENDFHVYAYSEENLVGEGSGKRTYTAQQ